MVFLKEVIICLSHRFLSIEGHNIVLEGAPTLAVGIKELFVIGKLLLLEGLVVDSSEVIIVEGDVLEFGSEDVHLAAILKDDLIIQMQQCFFGFLNLRVFNKGLPDLGLFEDEDLDNGAIGAEQLVQVVMGDDVAELVVDTYQ